MNNLHDDIAAQAPNDDAPSTIDDDDDGVLMVVCDSLFMSYVDAYFFSTIQLDFIRLQNIFFPEVL